MIDFKAQLRRQLQFLRNSCEFYDQGDTDEAVRIATSLRVIFHDTAKSVSLLSHLGAKGIKVLSTAAPFVEDAVMPNLYLVEATARIALAANKAEDVKRCVCEPILQNALRNDQIDLPLWWQGELIIEHKQPSTALTRKDLILAAANQDGGAHVDKKLNPTYDYAMRGSGVEVIFQFRPEWGRDPVTLCYENVHFGSLRQIAYEVLNSPEMLSLA